MHKLKVGLVLDDSLDKPDGVQQYVLMIGRWLAAQGHEVHYLVGETTRTDLPRLHSLSRNVKVRFNQNRMAMPLPASMKQIRALLKREAFDVLHVQVPYSPFLAGRIIKAAGPKTAVVGMFHILPHSRTVAAANHVLGAWVRAQGSLQRFDGMLANTAPTAEFAKHAFKIDSTIIPLPVDVKHFAAGKPFDRYKTGKTVMFMGRLVERKGCQYLLRAVAHAVENNDWPLGARVVVCGKGHLDAELKAYVKSHQLEKIVEFTGYIAEEDKPRYLASADIVVYPSTGGESFGIVLLEAMAASPGMVLAGNNPGYASVMAPHPQSLFEPKEVDVLSNKIITALRDDEIRKSAHAWQQQYIRNFDLDVVGKQTVAFYTQALHKRRG